MKRLYIPRIMEAEISSAGRQFPVVVLSGPRQSGKSTLLLKLLPNYNYCTLDDPFHRSMAIKDPQLFLEGLGDKVIIDEIQYAPQLLSYIKMQIDRKRNLKGQYYLSGSQIFPLMTGIGESLAGRTVLFELLGFSLAEITPRVRMNTLSDCFKLICKGFFPDPAVQGVNCKNYYRSYIQTYLERDIRQIKSIQDLHLFQEFLELLAARIGAILNLVEIAKECGISHTTAQKWLSLLETTRIIYLLRPYHRNISKRVIKRPKIYFTDTGLLTALLKYQDATTLMYGPLAGSFFENLAVIECLKYKFNHNSLFELYFFRDSNHNEIDLILDFGQKLKLVEIKMAKTLRDQHFTFLLRLEKTFPGCEKFLVYAGEETINPPGISLIHWSNIKQIFQ